MGVELTEKTIHCAEEVNLELIQGLTKTESDELLKLLQKVHNNMKDI